MRGGRRRDIKSDAGVLAKLLASAEAGQRERIARNLHDDVGQMLVLERLKLGELQRLVDGKAALRAGELAELMAATAEATRAAVFDIACPPWRDGLTPALDDLARRLRARGGVAVELDLAPPAVELPELHLAIVHRVVRELCLNAQKHAGAHRLRIASAVERGRLRVSVQDEGPGLPFDNPARPAGRSGGFGLASARAQLHAIGAELQIRSVHGRGTCASVLLPLTAPPDAPAGSAT